MPAAAGGTLTITPQWGGAKKRSYFNAFDLDRTEKGFVVSRFAFVRFGDCLDCMTIVLAETLVGHARTILLDYVKTVGLQAVKFDLKTPEIPRFAQGTVEIADVIDVARSDDVGEIAFHSFSLRYAAEAAKTKKPPASPEFVAILRSSITLQIKWIMSLYGES
jgi:hypothetical protein